MTPPFDRMIQPVRFLLLDLALLAMSARLMGQEIPEEQGFLARGWGAADGLPSETVTALAQTPDDFLWVGTDQGLVRFDGVKFEKPQVDGWNDLGQREILCLLSTRAGELWIGAGDSTLWRLSDGKLQRIPAPFPEGSFVITGFAEDESGEIWLGTDGKGVWPCLSKEARGQTIADGLPSDIVPAIISSYSGSAWLGAGSKVLQLQQGRWRVPDGLPSPGQRIDALALSPEGTLWVAVPGDNPLGGAQVLRMTIQQRGTESGALVGEQKLGWAADLEPYPWPPNLKQARITALLADRSGRVWVSPANGGLFCRSSGEPWHRVESQVMLANCLFEDRQGGIWMGTLQHGLRQFRRRVLTMLVLPGQAREHVVKTSFGARDGSIIVGTEGAGVFRFMGESCEALETQSGLHPRFRNVATVLEDSRTNLWAGTWGGLLRFRRDDRSPAGVAQNGWFEPVGQVEALRAPVIALFEDPGGDLWVGGNGGLVRLRDDAAQVFGRSAGLQGSCVRAITQSPHGILWVAMSDGGLFRKEGDSFVDCGVLPSTVNRYLRNISCDSRGSVWVATLNEGLFRVEDGRATCFTTGDGLPDSNLRGLVADGEGNLWVSSSSGIFRVSPAQLRDYVPGSSPRITCVRLSLSEGLLSRICSGEGQPMGTRTVDGRVCFPNRNGLAVFDPQSVAVDGSPARVQISGVFIDDQMAGPIPTLAAGLRLSSSMRRLEIHFSSPDLASPERLRFRYRMDDLDLKWIEADASRVAAYSQLRPGKYQFRVRASRNGEEWTELAPPLALEVTPMLWETRWFQLLCLAGVGAVLASGYHGWQRARVRRRLQQLETAQAVERERQRIAQDLHDDVGASVSQLTMLGELAGRQHASEAEAVRLLGAMRRTTQDLARQLDDVIWAVNPRHDSLAGLAHHLQQYATEFFEGSPIRCRIDIGLDLPAIVLPVQVRHGLFLAAKEALNNAARHSRAGLVWLRLRLQDSLLQVIIEDDGCGFELDSPGTRNQPGLKAGNGLANMHSRLDTIGGNCEIQTEPGQGCCVRLTIAVRQRDQE